MSYEELSYEELERAAEKLGRDSGIAAGSWVIDGNTSSDAARSIIRGYEDGDPQVMDMQPSPLSGEYADDPLPSDILLELGVSDTNYEDPGEWDDLLDAYERGFSDGLLV